MRVLICTLLVLAASHADQIKPAHITNYPFLRDPRFQRSSSRIVGGQEVVPNSVPYQVGLFIPTSSGTSFCGGSLISRTTVLTAAHCAEISTTIEVVLGAHRILEDEPTQVRLFSSNIIIHPNWDSSQLVNDIALIILSEPVELNENIQVIKLPANANSNYQGVEATVSGWGKDADSASSISSVLRSITIPIASNLICTLYYLGSISDSHLCASGDNAKSSCNGDSGGPLVTADGEQVGVVSFGLSLGCEIGWPHVYTRVTSFLAWIRANADGLE